MPLPKQAGNYTYQSNYGYQRPYPRIISPVKSNLKPVKSKRKIQRKKINIFAKIFLWIFLIVFAIYVLPYGYNRISKPLLFGPAYPEVQMHHHDLMRGEFFNGTDTDELLAPTKNYLYNDLFLNSRFLAPAKIKKSEMTPLYITDRMPLIEARLSKLMSAYKTIKPSIFVWDYDSGRYADINASNLYSAASIIKIPVLIQLFKSIEANQLTIYDEMILTSDYKAEGSGNLQYKASGSIYTIDELARAMITQSDNSATNMIMSAIGAMPDVNSGIRHWGLKHTQVNNWLPDLAGTNYTTARDLATMLYNLDNPGFLNINSREYIVDYLSHVENNRLIQAGLDPKALFIHKTGDIGKMLGDAGIVFAPNGKKYIVVILANRPYNSSLGKDFIQKASSIIYKSMMSGLY